MSDDPIVEQAAAAAASPASGPPHERRMAEIAAHPDWRNGGPEKAALLREMQQLTGVAAPAVDPTATTNEATRIRLTDELLDPKLSTHDRAEKLRQLRETIGRLETEDEKATRLQTDPRDLYNMKDPKQYASNRDWLNQYDADYRVYESDLADVAQVHGFDAPLVRSIRDAAVDLGQRVADTGRPASNEELAREFDRLRVPASARPGLVALWREIEGQP